MTRQKLLVTGATGVQTVNKPDEKRQGMKVRTVVTGHDAEGRAVFVRDEQVDATPIPGLGELAFLWNADQPAVAMLLTPAVNVASLRRRLRRRRGAAAFPPG